MLLLIVYKDQPELFDIRPENGWYSGFEMCSNQTFILAEHTPLPHNDMEVEIVRKLANVAPQHPFIRRMYKKVIRYYYPET